LGLLVTDQQNFGSSQLKVTPSPAYVGHPAFDESVTFQSRSLRNYGYSVAWAVHELAHHWGVRVRFKNPVTGEIQALSDSSGHWLFGMHAPSYRNVSQEFSTSSYVEASPMGGGAWTQNVDGTFTQSGLYFRNISGLSALDLYLVGALQPSEVSDTFVVQNLAPLVNGTYQGQEAPVRIQDIINAEGPRIPTFETSQKTFRLGVYLLHDPQSPPNSAMLSRAEGFANALVRYFELATDGRIKVVP
jgi:hypothetical protein